MSPYLQSTTMPGTGRFTKRRRTMNLGSLYRRYCGTLGRTHISCSFLVGDSGSDCGGKPLDAQSALSVYSGTPYLTDGIGESSRSTA